MREREIRDSSPPESIFFFARFSYLHHTFLVLFPSFDFHHSLLMASASSCYASPLCDWLVAACISSSGDRLAQSYTRRRRLLKSCSAVSAHGSAGVHALLSYCNNNALSPLFESNNTYLNRKQRRLNQASSSGITNSIQFI